MREIWLYDISIFFHKFKKCTSSNKQALKDKLNNPADTSENNKYYIQLSPTASGRFVQHSNLGIIIFKTDRVTSGIFSHNYGHIAQIYKHDNAYVTSN